MKRDSEGIISLSILLGGFCIFAWFIFIFIVSACWISLKIGPLFTSAIILMFTSCFAGLVWFRRGCKEE